jgi:hypothetical protein
MTEFEFRRRKPEQSGRYRCEHLDRETFRYVSHELWLDVVEQALNAGDAEGWKLVDIQWLDRERLLIIVWDTKPGD